MRTAIGRAGGVLDVLEAKWFGNTPIHRFGDSAREFDTVFWMRTPDYGAYMDVQHAVDLAMLREFSERGIAFAGEGPAPPAAPLAQEVEPEAPERRLMSR